MNKIKILIPIYNDWKSVFKLLEKINYEVSRIEDHFSIILINDASTEEKPEFLTNLDNLKSIQIINMKENRGHTRCNAAALKYILNEDDFDYAILMDGDGEDRPEELKLIISKMKDHPNEVITANRIKRSEGIFFKLCYFVHKYLTFVFAGQLIKFGNYSCLPKSSVNKMIDEAATWSSFSGSLAKTIKNRKFIPSIRGTRYFGPSKMSFINLLKHSLSIIAVFKTTLLIRSILFIFVYLFLILENISIITLIPIILVLVMVITSIILSKRENLSEFNRSLENIDEIINIK